MTDAPLSVGPAALARSTARSQVSTHEQPAGAGSAQRQERGERVPRVPSDPAATLRRWEEQAHLSSPVYPPLLEAVPEARRFVREQLEAVGLEDCAGDACLLVSELAANAVLHARGPFAVHLRPTLEGGVRVEVEDPSPLPPVLGAPSASAISGRGLDVVAAVSARWGSHPLSTPMGLPAEGDDVMPGSPGIWVTGPVAREGGDDAPPERPAAGKIVWFEVVTTAETASPELDTAQLLALWGGDEDEGDAAGAAPAAAAVAVARQRSEQAIITSSMPAVVGSEQVVVPDQPVTELLAAEEAVDDLLRELQLLLLATPATGTPSPTADGDRRRGPEEERHAATTRVAARLDAAARGFERGRRQVREQVVRAAAAGEASVTLSLHLGPEALERAREFRDASAAAAELSRSGELLAASTGFEHRAAAHRHLLDEVVRRLSERA